MKRECNSLKEDCHDRFNSHCNGGQTNDNSNGVGNVRVPLVFFHQNMHQCLSDKCGHKPNCQTSSRVIINQKIKNGVAHSRCRACKQNHASRSSRRNSRVDAFQ